LLLSSFFALRVFGPYMFNRISSFSKKVITEYPKIDGLFDINAIMKLFFETVTMFVLTMAPLLGIIVVTGLATGYAQVGFLFTTKTLAFKFER